MQLIINSVILQLTTETNSITMTKEADNRIAFQIEPSVKRTFKELCDERGSNMSVEIKRLIYKELKEAGK